LFVVNNEIKGTEMYYKLLLITTKDIFLDNSSSSYTIRSFLQFWPKDKIRQIVCSGFNEERRGVINENTYFLNSDDVCFASFFIKNQRSHVSSLGMTSNNSIYSVKSVKGLVMAYFKTFYATLPYRKSTDLKDFIADFKPDVLYSAFMDYRSLDMTLYMANKFKIPVLPHIMDDWLNTYFKQSTILKLFRKVFNKRIGLLFRKSPVVLCISDKMCCQYEERYNIKKTISLMHSVPQNKRKKVGTSCVKTLIYSGSLYLGRDQVIKVVGEILEEYNCQLKLFVPLNQWNELQEQFSLLSSVIYGGFVGQEELFQEICSSDGVILAESFDENMLVYTELSMSTKVPEYLSSGVPILAIGHKCQGSIEYLDKNHAAYVVDNIDNLKETIDELLSGNRNESIIQNAQMLFMKNHCQDKQCEKFYDAIKYSIER